MNKHITEQSAIDERAKNIAAFNDTMFMNPAGFFRTLHPSYTDLL